MEPGQKPTVPKRHPLAFPTKTEKVEPKVVKIVKQPEVSHVEKEVASEKKQGNDGLIVPTQNAEEKIISKTIPSESKVKELLGIKKEEPRHATEEKIQSKPAEESTTIAKVQVTVSKDPLISSKLDTKKDILHAMQKKNPEKHEAKNILLERSKIKTQIKPEIKIEAHNEMKVQVKTQIKQEIKPQTHEQPKQIKIQSKVETKPEPKKQSKPQIKVPEKEEIKIQTKPERKFQIDDISQSVGSKIQNKSANRHPVTIDIKDSTQKGSGLSKYTVYNITGSDDHGTIAISRKYEQFQSLSVILHERWPGCFIPALSKHTQIKNPDEKQKFKRVTLTNFLIGLSYSSHLYYREEVQLFLRSADVDVIQMFEKMPALKTRDVISRFKSSFGQDIQGASTPAHTEFNSKFVASLRKIINNLGTLSLKALALSQAYDHYSQSMIKFGKVQKSYEQLCLSEYTDTNREKALLAKDNENRIQRLKQLSKHNPFYKLYSFLSNQAKDAESFLQVIIASELFVLRKDDLEVEIKQLQNEIQAIMLGHKSLRTMTTRRPKEEVQAELEQKHKKLTQGKNTMIEMFSILEILLATKSIPLFKSFKRNNYKAILQEWVSFTSQTTPQIEAVWEFISEESKKCFKA